MPAADNCVMFDLEGLAPRLDELDKAPFWGTQVSGADPGDYQGAVVRLGHHGDRRGWVAVREPSGAVFEAYGHIPFIHWHRRETIKIRSYLDRYGDASGLVQRVLRNCVDLLPITRGADVLPDPRYSLKVVDRPLHRGRRD